MKLSVNGMENGRRWGADMHMKSRENFIALPAKGKVSGVYGWRPFA